MITAPLPRASPSGTGRLSMIIPQYYGLTITYLFYTSYSYNSISRYANHGISAHIPRRDLVIICVLRSH